jgi:hypothetical protein
MGVKTCAAVTAGTVSGQTWVHQRDVPRKHLRRHNKLMSGSKGVHACIIIEFPIVGQKRGDCWAEAR